jgi:hypothetical protein
VKKPTQSVCLSANRLRDCSRLGTWAKGNSIKKKVLHVVQNLRVLAVRGFVVDIPWTGEPKKSSGPFAAATPLP